MSLVLFSNMHDYSLCREFMDHLTFTGKQPYLIKFNLTWECMMHVHWSKHVKCVHETLRIILHYYTYYIFVHALSCKVTSIIIFFISHYLFICIILFFNYFKYLIVFFFFNYIHIIQYNRSVQYNLCFTLWLFNIQIQDMSWEFLLK